MAEENRIEIGQLDWVAIPPELRAGLSHRLLTRRKLRVWLLVLEARRIPCRSEQAGRGWQLLVPTEYYRQACEELLQYEQENRNWPPPPPADQKLHENTASSIWVLILLAIFHNIVAQRFNPFGPGPLDWVEHGTAHAGKILNGEWWRLATALTLHSGPLHLAYFREE